MINKRMKSALDPLCSVFHPKGLLRKMSVGLVYEQYAYEPPAQPRRV